MNEENLKKTITDCFVRLKKNFYEKHTIEEYEDDTNPQILSKRDVIEALPPSSIQIIEIINESVDLKSTKGFLFKYDYTQQDSKKIEFLGSVSTTNPRLIQIIGTKLGFKENQFEFMFSHICTDFMNFTTWEPKEDWCLQFIGGDVETNPDLFYHEWEMWTFWNHGVPGLSEKFQRERFEDFNKIYGLKNDPILSLSEITESASQMTSFRLDLESIQKQTAHIQLIPKVPDDVKKNFSRAKKLFLFGYFEYELFTIAEHYAFMALESAIKTRYIQSLGDKAILTIPKKNLKQEITYLSHFDIIEFCNKRRKIGWDIRKLVVNGEEFPYSNKKLLDWLEKNHLIRKWEKGIYESGLQLRNYFSHPEKPSTMLPGANLLHIIGNEINHIFHQEIPK